MPTGKCVNPEIIMPQTSYDEDSILMEIFNLFHQCIVCQADQGVFYCSVTYTRTLSTKERLSHSRFKPTFYCVIYPYESVLYSSRGAIPEVISDSLVKMYGATRLNRLPLEGRDFRSLRQLYHNKARKGMLRRRPVKDTHPLNSLDNVNNTESTAASNLIHNQTPEQNQHLTI